MFLLLITLYHLVEQRLLRHYHRWASIQPPTSDVTEFPLFRLPLLPLKSVLDKMYLGDLIRFHLCSKKTRQILNAAKKTVNFDTLSHEQKQNLNILETLDLLRLETYSNPRGSLECFPERSVTIAIKVSGDNGIEVNVGWDYCIANRYLLIYTLTFHVELYIHEWCPMKLKQNFEINGMNVPVIMNDKRRVHTFWNDQSDGLNFMIDYFKKLFNLQTIKCSIQGSENTKFSRDLRAAVKGMAHHTITNCLIHGGAICDNDYKFILNNVKPTIRFQQSCNVRGRSDDFKHKTSFSSEYCELGSANWFTQDNLISTNCEHITLWKSKLNNIDMYEYLKLWMTGSFSKLKSLSVELHETANFDFIYSRLQGYSKRYTVVRTPERIYFKEQGNIVARITSDNKRSIFQFTVFGVN